MTQHETDPIEVPLHLVDLAHPRLGTEVVAVSDEFFASKERLIDPADPVFRAGVYDDHGKWMDGWETARRRTGGHDDAVIRLGVPGRVRVIDVDTSFFTGNYPPAVSIEGCSSPTVVPADDEWRPMVPMTSIGGDAHHLIAIDDPDVVTHVRLHLHPDGGVARLRLHGEVHHDWDTDGPDEGADLVDLAALVHGGTIVTWSDAHYGEPQAILAPGPGVNMNDGWETARRRVPGHEWIIVALGHVGTVEQIVVDTTHNKGNFPHRCTASAGLIDPAASPEVIANEAMFWPELLDARPLTADAVHHLDGLADLGPVSHVRFDIHPDGGISRLRLMGRPGGVA